MCVCTAAFVVVPFILSTHRNSYKRYTWFIHKMVYHVKQNRHIFIYVPRLCSFKCVQRRRRQRRKYKKLYTWMSENETTLACVFDDDDDSFRSISFAYILKYFCSPFFFFLVGPHIFIVYLCCCDAVMVCCYSFGRCVRAREFDFTGGICVFFGAATRCCHAAIYQICT